MSCHSFVAIEPFILEFMLFAGGRIVHAQCADVASQLKISSPR